MSELNESQLVEMMSEIMGATGVVTFLYIDREKANRYEGILSRNGFETTASPMIPNRVSTPTVINQYQLTIRNPQEVVNG